MNKQILIDVVSTYTPDNNIMEDYRKQPGRLIVSGVVQRCDALNQNRRIYPKSVLEAQVERYKERIQSQNSFGELDHPERAETWLQNSSHIVRNIWWQGNDVMAEIEILPFLPNGRILKDMFEYGLSVGISSRGIGSLQEAGSENGNLFYRVGEDFELLGFDFVSNPSTHGAFMKPVTEANMTIERNPSPAAKDSYYSNIENILRKINA